MPYASEKQRRYMWSQHPEIAKKWQEKGHGGLRSEIRSPKKKIRKKKDS